MGCLSGLGFFRTYIGYILIVSKEQLLQSMGTGGIRKWDFATFVTGSNSPEIEKEETTTMGKIIMQCDKC